MRGWLLAATLLGLGSACDRAVPPAVPTVAFKATDITGAPWGKDFRLTDHQGRQRTLADFRGRLVAIFFGYTHCPDVCPTTLSDFAMALRELGDDGKRVQVLFVTVDPERDTQELLARYVPSFNPDFLGLYTDPVSLATLAKDFKVVYQKNTPPSSKTYLIDHSAGTYVYDASGQLRLLIPYGAGPQDIAHDLRLLLEKAPKT
jgi:protein SCO1/2